MDLAIFKCLAQERMETIKNETYGKNSYKNEQMRKLKMNMTLLLHVCL